VLLLVLTHFEGVLVNGEARLLELYESQFSIAVRIGLQTDFALSGELLIQYLEFTRQKKDSAIADDFDLFVTALAKCKQATVAYFAIACYLCGMARERAAFEKRFTPFARRLVSQLCEIVAVSMALWQCDPVDYEEERRFRESYAGNYANMLEEFVWLQSVLKRELIGIEVIVQFCLREIRTASDFWRRAAGFQGLKMAIVCYRSAISDALLAQAMDVARNCEEPSLHGTANAFLHACSVSLCGNGANWEPMMTFALESDFNLESFANLVIVGANSPLLRLVGKIMETIVEAFGSKIIGNQEVIALFTLLFEKGEVVLESCLKFLCEPISKTLAVLKFDLYRRALRRSSLTIVSPFVTPIGRFAWGNYKQGGMVLLSQILIENPSVGVEFLTFDNLEIMKVLCLSDSANCVVYMEFIRFGYSVYRSLGSAKPEFEVSAARIAFETLNRWSDDLQNGEGIATNCINLLQDIQAADGEFVKEAFLTLTLQVQRILITSIQKQTSRIETRKRIRDLKTFSTATRRGRDSMDDGDWETLDTE
jgi:hypothetical protein